MPHILIDHLREITYKIISLLKKHGFFKNLGFDSGEHSQILNKLPEGIPEKVIIDGIIIDLRMIVALADFPYPYSVFRVLTNEEIITIVNPGKTRTPEGVFEDYFIKLFKHPKTLKKILSIIEEEEKGIAEYKKKGLPPNQYYDKNGGKLNREYTFADPDYIPAAFAAFDHFWPDALQAYQVGRNMAYKLAQQAFSESDQTKKKELFDKACAYQAFALHYFSDIFAGGHRITLHHELVDQCGLILGSFLTKAQHDETNWFGPICTNKKGGEMQFQAYGDGHYFNKENAENRKMLEEAALTTMNVLVDIYKTGKIPDKHKEEDYVLYPLPDTEQPNQPLFKLKENSKVILRRKIINDPACKEYTEDWHVIPTLVECWLAERKWAYKKAYDTMPKPNFFASCFFPTHKYSEIDNKLIEKVKDLNKLLQLDIQLLQTEVQNNNAYKFPQDCKTQLTSLIDKLPKNSELKKELKCLFKQSFVISTAEESSPNHKPSMQ